MRNLLATPFPRRPAPIRARARLLAGTALAATVALLVALCLFVSDVWAQAGPEQKPSNLTASLVVGRHPAQLGGASGARPTEVSGYQILRRRPDEGEARLLVLVADTGSAATSYLDASATAPGVEYLYRVKARRGDELSGWTNNVRLTYSAPPPDAGGRAGPDRRAGLGRRAGPGCTERGSRSCPDQRTVGRHNPQRRREHGGGRRHRPAGGGHRCHRNGELHARRNRCWIIRDRLRDGSTADQRRPRL